MKIHHKLNHDIPNLKNKNTKIYLVGGAVRDLILGQEPKDLDYVIVNGDEQELIDLGFERVGESFPVFLHPETGNEFALARKEIKTGEGYQGFDFDIKDVSIVEDLGRRDITINSMAIDLDTKDLIDPYGGFDDLKNKIIKHTTIAFKEDPLRVLRIARFQARYNFKINNETFDLCKKMVQDKELEFLSKERILLEIDKVLEEKSAFVFFKTLKEMDYLKNIGIFETLLNTNNFNDMSKQLRYKIVFFNFNENEMRKSKLDADKIQGINLFKKWFEKFNNGYANLELEEKLNIIKDFKVLHSENLIKDFLKDVLFFKTDMDMSNELNLINNDIIKLKEIDYTQITVKNKESIFKIQCDALLKNNQSISFKIR